MMDITIISEKVINYDDLIVLMKKEFKNYNFLNDNDRSIFIQKHSEKLEVEFLPGAMLNDPNCDMEDTIDKVPIKDSYLINIHYSSLSLAKRTVKLMLNIGGKTWVQSNEYDDWFGTSEEFLNNYIYKKSDEPAP